MLKLKSAEQHEIEKMKVIAAEIRHFERIPTVIERKIQTPIITQQTKRARRVKDATAEQPWIIDNMIKIVAETHEVGKQNGPDESDDETPIITLRS